MFSELQALRRVSPVVSVSERALRRLDLPPPKDDVDHIGRLLKPFWVFLVIILVLLVWLLFVCFKRWSVEEIADECALEHRVVTLWVDRALLVMQDLVELILRLACCWHSLA